MTNRNQCTDADLCKSAGRINDLFSGYVSLQQHCNTLCSAHTHSVPARLGFDSELRTICIDKYHFGKLALFIYAHGDEITIRVSSPCNNWSVTNKLDLFFIVSLLQCRMCAEKMSALFAFGCDGGDKHLSTRNSRQDILLEFFRRVIDNRSNLLAMHGPDHAG